MKTTRRTFLLSTAAFAAGGAATPVPVFRERAVYYLNIGHAIPPLTVNQWPESHCHNWLSTCGEDGLPSIFEVETPMRRNVERRAASFTASGPSSRFSRFKMPNGKVPADVLSLERIRVRLLA